MADVSVTAAEVRVVNPQRADIRAVFLAETVTKGQTLYVASSGKYGVADANVAGQEQVRAIALQGGGANQAIQACFEGDLYGFDLAGVAYDTVLYQSDTAGAVADAAPLVAVPLGLVAPIADDPSGPTKVFRFKPRGREDYS